MEPAEYGTLFSLEQDYWWFRALRAVLADAQGAAGLPTNARVLDAGCGTGMLAAALQRSGARVFAFDRAAEASHYWSRRGLTTACRGSVNEIPFGSDTFDAVFAVDLLECDGVEEQQACVELLRVVRPGGYVFLVVPAYDWLMSPEHHRAVHASRRYTRSRITAALTAMPARVVRATHLFMTVFPPIAVYRVWRSLQGPTAIPRSELRAMSPWVDTLLFALTDWERVLLRRVDLPIGSSILVVLHRRHE